MPGLGDYSAPLTVKMSSHQTTSVVQMKPSSGLAVISAPPPLRQREEIASAPAIESAHSMVHATPVLLEDLTGLRTTRSQRIRGASNNMKAKQLEMRGNQTFVYS